MLTQCLQVVKNVFIFLSSITKLLTGAFDAGTSGQVFIDHEEKTRSECIAGFTLHDTSPDIPDQVAYRLFA